MRANIEFDADELARDVAIKLINQLDYNTLSDYIDYVALADELAPAGRLEIDTLRSELALLKQRLHEAGLVLGGEPV
jgi:hypothetical protein